MVPFGCELVFIRYLLSITASPESFTERTAAKENCVTILPQMKLYKNV